MSKSDSKRVGFFIGADASWAEAVIQAINAHENVELSADLVSLGSTFLKNNCPFDLIIDRMSHEIPYYRAYLKNAALQGCYIVNNPFVAAIDDKFLGLTIARKLGIKTPRSVLLPNKRVSTQTRPESFRNLMYLDWQGVINHVGVPAILKDAHTGGRRISVRVHNVDELISSYDESDTLNVVIQELIPSDFHIHCFIINNEVLPLYYSLTDGYIADNVPTPELQEQLTTITRQITNAYQYDINMAEFVFHQDELYLINASNPQPIMSRKFLPADAFHWTIQQTVALAIAKLNQNTPQPTLIHLPS
ncbi:MAG TPA: hypothetical protein VLL52_20885 [Anaerolineae bacterium]|nr:hypothetical protein [Anaerolineae bacterium]